MRPDVGPSSRTQSDSNGRNLIETATEGVGVGGNLIGRPVQGARDRAEGGTDLAASPFIDIGVRNNIKHIS